MEGPEVLIIKMSSLGDIVHALPVAHSLKAGLKAKVSWVVNSSYAEILKHSPDVDEIIRFHKERPLISLPRFLIELLKSRYDLVIDLMGLFKSGLIARLARGRRLIGPSYTREFSHIFYPEFPGSAVHSPLGRIGGPRRRIHAVDENLEVIRHLGLEERRSFNLIFPPRPLPAAEGRRVVVLVPEARWPTKRWPYENFLRLGEMLAGRDILTLLVGSSPPSSEARRLEAGKAGGVQPPSLPASQPRYVIDLRGKTGLEELGAILKRADLVIGADTGPVHLASALGTKVIALMGPTDPMRTGPYGEGHRVMRRELPCSPCYLRSCPDNICLKGITPEEVLGEALKVLE